MACIEVIGLGAGDIDQLPLGLYRKLQRAEHLYVRTEEHPVVRQLAEEGLTFTSCDDLYIKEERFEDVYAAIVQRLVAAAKQDELRKDTPKQANTSAADAQRPSILYAVPGHPLVAEQTVQLLLREAERDERLHIRIAGGHSFLDAMFTSVRIDPNEGFILLDGTDLKARHLQPELHVVISQVYDPFIASEVKLTLMEVYPDEHPVYVVTEAGRQGKEQVTTMPLYELDRQTEVSNLTAVYVPPAVEESVLNRRYETSRDIFRTLRGENGCPWDKKQTHTSLMPYLTEETEEVLQAIKEEDWDHLPEELGDVLLQLFLHAQIAEDNGYFNMEDVLQSLNEKMIRRHPHVFGDVEIKNSAQLKELWQQIKAAEKSDRSTR